MIYMCLEKYWDTVPADHFVLRKRDGHVLEKGDKFVFYFSSVGLIGIYVTHYSFCWKYRNIYYLVKV